MDQTDLLILSLHDEGVQHFNELTLALSGQGAAVASQGGAYGRVQNLLNDGYLGWSRCPTCGYHKYRYLTEKGKAALENGNDN